MGQQVWDALLSVTPTIMDVLLTILELLTAGNATFLGVRR